MANFKRMILLLAIILPAICFAQPGVCEVSFTGKQPTIKDFARAYCSQFDQGSFETKAALSVKRLPHLVKELTSQG